MPCPSHVDYDVSLDDTGQTISRQEPIDTSMVVVEDPSMEVEATLEVEMMLPSSHPTNGVESSMSNFFC